MVAGGDENKAIHHYLLGMKKIHNNANFNLRADNYFHILIIQCENCHEF